MARRMPISRVRSVTDTSMMFMMPMPPTSRLTAAIAASSAVSVRVVPAERRRQLLLIHDAEVVVVRVGQPPAFAHEPRDVLLRLFGRDRLADGQLNLVDVVAAGQPALEGAHRHDDDVVAVHAEGILAFRLQQADHLARHRAQPQALADDLGGSEQFLAHGFADDADG